MSSKANLNLQPSGRIGRGSVGSRCISRSTSDGWSGDGRGSEGICGSCRYQDCKRNSYLFKKYIEEMEREKKMSLENKMEKSRTRVYDVVNAILNEYVSSKNVGWVLSPMYFNTTYVN